MKSTEAVDLIEEIFPTGPLGANVSGADRSILDPALRTDSAFFGAMFDPINEPRGFLPANFRNKLEFDECGPMALCARLGG